MSKPFLSTDVAARVLSNLCQPWEATHLVKTYQGKPVAEAPVSIQDVKVVRAGDNYPFRVVFSDTSSITVTIEGSQFMPPVDGYNQRCVKLSNAVLNEIMNDIAAVLAPPAPQPEEVEPAPSKPFVISKGDVGREVVLRNGDTAKIIRVESHVWYKHGAAERVASFCGSWHLQRELIAIHQYDIVAFKTPDVIREAVPKVSKWKVAATADDLVVGVKVKIRSAPHLKDNACGTVLSPAGRKGKVAYVDIAPRHDGERYARIKFSNQDAQDLWFCARMLKVKREV